MTDHNWRLLLFLLAANTLVTAGLLILTFTR